MAQMDLSQLGFAEFVGKLLAEVFEAVITAQIEQARRAAELAESALSTPEEAVERFVEEGDVEVELAQLFPSGRPDLPHAVQPGAPYQPSVAGGGESPPFARLLGLDLVLGQDFATVSGGSALTAAGVARIRDAARLRLAVGHLAALRRIAAQGVPRVHVDSGRVQAKLTFQLAEETPSPPPAPAQALALFAALPAGERRRFPTFAEARPLAAVPALPALRLAVRQASDRAPQLSRLSADVFGEVEVRFKTLV